MDSVIAAFDTIESAILKLEEACNVQEDTPSEGLEFLEAKSELNLSYLVNLSYYLVLKTMPGTPLPDVFIEQLFKIRWLLQRAKPLDQKMQYSIEKLIKMTEAPEKVATAQPGKLRSDVTGPVTEDIEEEEQVADADGSYKAPKFSPAEVQSKITGEDKLEKEVERKRKRFEQGELMRSLREEFVDAPQEIGTVGADIKGSKELEVLHRKQQEKIRYEEDNFMRMQVTRKDKKEMRRLKQLQNKSAASGVASLQDVADIDHLVRSDRRLADLEGAREKLKRRREAGRPDMQRGDGGHGDGSGSRKKHKRR